MRKKALRDRIIKATSAKQNSPKISENPYKKPKIKEYSQKDGFISTAYSRNFPFPLPFPFISLSCLIFNLISSFPVLAEGIRLGVVRSPDNATQWSGIATRLNESGVPYCVVDLEKVRTAADLSGPTVLFLPNVESLNQEQAIALEAWMNKGGRSIVSGPLGTLSPPGVRQKLRSLFGAYWAFPLSEPEALQPMRTRTQEWVTSQLSGTIHGGVIIPTALNSQTAAIWTISDSPPAVITTNRTTFLGWRWGVGSASSSEVDLGWLKAALSRYGNVAQVGTTPPPTGRNCVSPNALPNVAFSPRSNPQARVANPQPPVSNSQTRVSNSQARVSNPQPPVSNSQVRVSNSQARVSNSQARVSNPQPPVSNPQARVSNPQPPVSNSQPPVSNPQPQLPTTQPPTVDPTERVATAAVRVIPGGEAISDKEAIAMRQELENLIGRVESALLAVNATDNRVAGEAGTKETIPVNSSPTNVASTIPIGTQNSPLNTLQNARDVLQKFPQLIAQRDYATARSQWLQARQSLWNLYPLDRSIQQPEVRAIWLDRGTIVQAGSEQGLAKIFDRLAQAGINTIFFETVNAGYTIYPSQVAPEQNPLTKGWNPLAAGVKLAHERGMELHAWVWTFATGNQRHNEILNQPANYPGPIITAHPDWANYDNRGNIIPAGQTKPFLDPANLEVRQYLLKLFDEIVTRYNVDGLQLDYIRYPFQDPSQGSTYGYGKAARQLFQELAGVDPLRISPSNRPLWQKWTDFRTNQINSFVAEVSQLLRQRRSNLILSAAVFAYPEAERIEKLQQNWELWARRGDVDLIVPMAYAQDTNKFSQLTQPWLSNTNLGSTLVLPGIFLLNLPEISAVDQIQFVRDLPNGGYSLFAAEHFGNQLQSILSRTQGAVENNSKEPIPYRQPFAAAAAIYAGIQREWNFLLSSDRLQLPSSAREPFNKQTQAVYTALDRLAQEQNSSNFVVARNAVKELRSQFRSWMILYSTQNSYQVQTWDNRLANLEKLLNYGERVVLNRQAAVATPR